LRQTYPLPFVLYARHSHHWIGDCFSRFTPIDPLFCITGSPVLGTGRAILTKVVHHCIVFGLTVIDCLIAIVTILQTEFLPVRHVLSVVGFCILTFVTTCPVLCSRFPLNLFSYSRNVGAHVQPIAAPLAWWDSKYWRGTANCGCLYLFSIRFVY